MKTREDALNLLHEWVKSDSLRKHCYSVAASMEAYAVKFGENSDEYWIAGLLHDFDYEKHPTLEMHPSEGVKVLEKEGYSKEVIHTILGHGNHTGVKRESLMDKTLFAVDELSGLVVALARVRPGNFSGMSASSVKKVLKKKEFAAAISREDIKQGILDLNVNEEEHYELVISALAGIKDKFGF